MTYLLIAAIAMFFTAIVWTKITPKDSAEEAGTRAVKYNTARIKAECDQDKVMIEEQRKRVGL